MSGAFGPAYGIQREDEDLAAIVEIICCIVVNVRPRSGNVAWLELVASLPAELDPVLDTEGTLELYRQLDAQVLLMYGSETDPMFLDCAEALHRVLPHSTVLWLPGLNHDSAQTYGKPETIAAVLRLFFSQ